MSVNLLPPPPPAVRRRVLVTALLVAAWCLAAVLLAAGWYGTSQANRVLALETAQASTQVTTLTRELTALNAKQQELALGSAVARAQAAAPNPSAAIASLVSLLPPAASVQVLNYASGYVTVQVAFPDLPNATRTLARIAHDTAFTTPVVQSVTAGPTGVVVSLGLALTPSAAKSTGGMVP